MKNKKQEKQINGRKKKEEKKEKRAIGVHLPRWMGPDIGFLHENCHEKS